MLPLRERLLRLRLANQQASCRRLTALKELAEAVTESESYAEEVGEA